VMTNISVKGCRPLECERLGVPKFPELRRVLDEYINMIFGCRESSGVLSLVYYNNIVDFIIAQRAAVRLPLLFISLSIY